MPRFLCQFVSLTFKEAGPGHKIIPESLWEALSFFRGYKNHPFGFFTAHSKSPENSLQIGSREHKLLYTAAGSRGGYKY